MYHFIVRLPTIECRKSDITRVTNMHKESANRFPRREKLLHPFLKQNAKMII